MNRKLLPGLVLDARGRGDRVPQRLRYLVEPIALAGNISHMLRLLFLDHSVPLIGISPARDHCELLTVIGASNWPHRSAALVGSPPSCRMVGRAHELRDKPQRTVAVPARTRQRAVSGGTYIGDAAVTLAGP
jgi:hypothetical protein